MAQLTKEEQLNKLVDNGFISVEQKKGFEKLTQEELNHLVEQSEVIKSLDAEKTEAVSKSEKQEEQISTLEKEKAEIEAERDEALTKLEAVKTDSKAVKKVEPGLKFKFRGGDYKFKDTAPKTIKYGDVPLTQKELAKDEDAILHLLTNSGLIEKI